MNIPSTVLHINVARAALGRYLVTARVHHETGPGAADGGGSGAGPLVLDDDEALKTWLANLAKEVK